MNPRRTMGCTVRLSDGGTVNIPGIGVATMANRVYTARGLLKVGDRANPEVAFNPSQVTTITPWVSSS